MEIFHSHVHFSPLPNKYPLRGAFDDVYGATLLTSISRRCSVWINNCGDHVTPIIFRFSEACRGAPVPCMEASFVMFFFQFLSCWQSVLLRRCLSSTLSNDQKIYAVLNMNHVDALQRISAIDLRLALWS